MTEVLQPHERRRQASKAVRAAAVATLICEAIVLMLALQPLRQVSDASGAAVGFVAVLAGLCAAGCFLLRFRVGWWAVLGLNLVIIASGWLHPALAVLGVIFTLVWIYVMRVRHTVA